MPTADAGARHLETDKLVTIARQEAVKLDMYLARIPKELVESVDAALLVNDSVLPVHQFLLISSSSVLRDIVRVSSQACRPHQAIAIPMMDMREDVQTAVAYLYKRLSQATSMITSIEEAKRLVKFGHKYGVQVLLDESDVFIHNWCKQNFSTLSSAYYTAQDRQRVVSKIQSVLEWTVLAESGCLDKTLELCNKWFVAHFWCLEAHLQHPYGRGVSAELAQLRNDTLACILSEVANKYSPMVNVVPVAWLP